MAAKAVRPATTIELPTVLAAPVKVAIGEPVAIGGMTLVFSLDAEVLRIV